MPTSYPGKRAQLECARRTREELIAYAPRRPLALRDELRVKVMLARCAACGSCPLVARALGIMAPKVADAPSNVIEFKLAS